MMNQPKSGLHLLAFAFLLASIQAQQAFPEDKYRPTVTISSDLDPQKGQVNITLTLTAATNAHTVGGVTSYEIRFGTSSADRLGKQIAVITGSNLASEMTVSFSGATRALSSDSYPSYINTFVLNSDNVANPSPISEILVDKSVPLLTPLVSTSYSQFEFVDVANGRDVFSGNLIIHLDSFAIQYNDTDGTLASITNYLAYPVCQGVVGSLVWNGTYNQAAKAMRVEGQQNITYDATGCTNFPNTFIVYAANKDGQSLKGVVIALEDLVDQLTVSTDLDVGTSAHVATYTPEKSISSLTLSLNYGDYFQLAATFASVSGERDLFTWKGYWYCGDRPVYFFDFGSSTNLQTPSSAANDIIASSGAQYAASPVQCTAGYSVMIAGTLTSASTLALRGPETTRSARSKAIKVVISPVPTTPTWACPYSGPTATIEADTIVGSITGSLAWTTNVATQYLSATTGRKPDYFVVFGSNDTVEDAGDKRIKVIPYVESQGTYTWTFSGIPFYSFMYVNAYESSGDGALTSCNKFTSRITEISVTTAPAGIVSATFSDEDGNQNRIRGYVIATLPTGLSNDTTIQVYFATGTTSADVNSATLLDTKSVLTDILQDPTTLAYYVKLRVACNSNFLTSNVSATNGCDLFVSTTNTQYDYLQIYSVGNGGLFSQPYSVRITDRNDPYALLADLYSYSGLSTQAGVKYYPTVQQTTQDNQLVSGKVTLTWTTANLAAAQVTSSSGALVTLIDLSSIFLYDVVLGSTSDTTPDCHLSPNWNGAAFPYDLDYPANAYGGVENASVITADSLTMFVVVSDYSQLVRCGFEPDSSNPLKIKGQMTQYILTAAQRQDSAGSFVNDYIPQMTITAYVEITYLDTTHASAANVQVINVVVLDDVEEVVQTESAVRFYNPGFTSEKTNLNFMARSEKMYVEHYITANTQMFYVTLSRFWFAQEAFSTSQVELQVDGSDAAFTNVDNPVEKARYRFETTVPIVMNCRPCYMHLESKLTLESSTSANKKSLPFLFKRFKKSLEDDSTSSARALVIEIPGSTSISLGSSADRPTAMLIAAVGALATARFVL